MFKGGGGLPSAPLRRRELRGQYVRVIYIVVSDWLLACVDARRLCPASRLRWVSWALSAGRGALSPPLTLHPSQQSSSPSSHCLARRLSASQSSSEAQWPYSRRLHHAKSAHLKQAGMEHPLSVSVWLPAGRVSCGWCAEGFTACLCLTLLWKAPIPSGDQCTTGRCIVITMSPASAATASESAAATTTTTTTTTTNTVPEEETESPREEVRTNCLQRTSSKLSLWLVWCV